MTYYKPKELYHRVMELGEFDRIELHNNGDGTAEIKVYNWDNGTENIIGTLIAEDA